MFTSSTGADDLFYASKLKSMCQLEDEVIRQSSTFERICIRNSKKRGCCRSWSLGNYVALLSNRSSCYDIDDASVQRVLELVHYCRSSFQTHSHIPQCWTSENMVDIRCGKIPKRCRKHGAIYSILLYLTDIDFVDEGLSPRVSYAMAFLPIAAGIGTRDLFYELQGKELSDGITSIVAINFGIKQDVFDRYLVTDMVWFGMGLACVIVLMWLYTASFFIMITTVVLIFLSLEISFFLYSIVFQVSFFPFMNLLIVIILIGVGVDDVFIYCRIWCLGKSQKNSMTLERLVTTTLRHATLSMSVTSLTTAAALYSSYVSSVLVLRCFAIFAGTAVVVNFVLMVIWMPTVIIVQEKWWSSSCLYFTSDSCRMKPGFCCYVCNSVHKLFAATVACFSHFFISVLPCVVVKLRYLWLTLFGTLGVGGVVVVLICPKLRLPSTNEFQLFAHDHLFEVYDLKIKDLFWFEKAAKDNKTSTMPITVVWGVQASHSTNRLDPTDKGELVFDENFNVSTPEAQKFLFRFCRSLRAAKYYRNEAGTLLLTNCFMENFRVFMRRPCLGLNGTSFKPCCGLSEFPFDKDIFNLCIKEYIPWLSKPVLVWSPNPNAGLRFAPGHDRPVAIVVEFDSIQPFSLNYSQMREFYTYMNDLVTRELERAPGEMKNGWFVSNFMFYDLQQSIAQSTPIAIGLSISIAFIVAFLTTLNVLITIYSMLTIAAAIFVTVAILVLIGWELNVLESVTISVAVGLSIDYSLHYGMAYRLSPDLDRHTRVVDAIKNISSPVSMAAATTFLVGACLMPSTVLAYRQLGIFLMIVISVSWTYATFFFQSLLLIVGPKGSFGQLRWPSLYCARSSYEQKHIDKTVYAMSDSTLSSSSTTNHINSSETQELEQLTERLPLPRYLCTQNIYKSE